MGNKLIKSDVTKNELGKFTSGILIKFRLSASDEKRRIYKVGECQE